MKLQYKHTRQILRILGATAAGAFIAWMGRLALDAGPAWQAALAALAAALTAHFTKADGDDGGTRRFAQTVSEDIDAIMIGAAETSYFVDSVKKKIEHDVQTASDIVASSTQNARTTEKIAANAERAARVAARVRAETETGRATTRRKQPRPWPACRKNRAASMASRKRSRKFPRAPICWR
jgi:methyl-accepting chemotaxis protein